MNTKRKRVPAAAAGTTITKKSMSTMSMTAAVSMNTIMNMKAAAAGMSIIMNMKDAAADMRIIIMRMAAAAGTTTAIWKITRAKRRSFVSRWRLCC